MKNLLIIILLTTFTHFSSLLFPVSLCAKNNADTRDAGVNEQELATFYPDQVLKLDIDFDDEDERIRLTSAGIYENDDYTNEQVYILKVVEGENYVSSIAVLMDSWQLVYLFTVEIYPTLPPYIAVGYTDQGEIPYSIDLFRYKDNLLRNIGNLKKIAHFESDVGSILLKDVDGDDIKEIVVRNKTGDVVYKYIDDDRWEKLSSPLKIGENR